MERLKFQNISYSSEKETILKNISVTVESGDFVSIVGPSGSGKSTLLKLCSHLISPTAGKIFFDGKDMLEYDPVELRKRIAYCRQTPVLFGESVEDNLAFPYSIRNLKVDMKRISELFCEFNLMPEFRHKDVKNLSGGEKQRIALIRTLLFKPEILLLDEVTSALDADNSAVVEGVIDNLNKEGVTLLWVTHNQEQSKRYANKLLTMENGQIKSYEVLK